MEIPSWYWVIATAFVVFVLFLPAEIIAVRNKHVGDTYSENIWRLLFPKPDKPYAKYRRWIRIAILMFFVWLSIHLLTGGYI